MALASASGDSTVDGGQTHSMCDARRDLKVRNMLRYAKVDVHRAYTQLQTKEDQEIHLTCFH